MLYMQHYFYIFVVNKFKIMKKNIGSIDKIIRFIVGAIVIWVAYTQVTSPWNYVLYGVAALAVITAFAGTCPTWLIFGVNTIKSKKK